MLAFRFRGLIYKASVIGESNAGLQVSTLSIHMLVLSTVSPARRNSLESVCVTELFSHGSCRALLLECMRMLCGQISFPGARVRE